MPAAPDAPAADVRHDPGRSRFTLATAAGEAVCTYVRGAGAVTFTHVGVPEGARGGTVAARLVRAALAWARAEGLRAEAACVYVAAYLQRHPEAAGDA